MCARGVVACGVVKRSLDRAHLGATVHRIVGDNAVMLGYVGDIAVHRTVGDIARGPTSRYVAFVEMLSKVVCVRRILCV